MTTLPAMAAERAIIVLDASGSMWGQIEGKAKIEIARNTLGQVLGGLPSDLELGLIAYGHREKGQCKDIELMVPAGAGTADAIANAVNGIKPKGKTPLSDAVLQAAESLKYTEDKATVILITDGLETCSADPCALGRSLEEAGVDFTAHVVGFGLSDKEGKEVACLADETGGVYISAGNEDELVQALNETVAPPEPVEEAPKASLEAPDQAEIASVITVTWDAPGEKNDRITLFDPNARQGNGTVLRHYPIRYGDVAAKTVDVTVPAVSGVYQLQYFHNGSQKILATRDITITPAPVVLFAPDTIPIAKTLTVEWIGPGAKNDSIRLWDPSANGGQGKRLKESLLRYGDFENRSVEMPAPGKPGTYELRYWNSEDREVLATRLIEVTEAVVSLETEPPHSVGQPIVIDWIGPGARNDTIRLWDPNANAGDGKQVFEKRLRNDDFENQRLTLPGPGKAGTYELRYWNLDNRMVLATKTIEVEETVVSLNAPEEIEAGATLTVGWEGPGARYDEVQLWDPNAKGGDGKQLFHKRLRNADFDNKTVKMPAPAKPGAYELRYYHGDSRTVLATKQVEVIEVAVSLDAPETQEAARTIKVTWEGPGARYDEVQIWDPNAKGGEGKQLFNKRVRNDDFENRKVTLPGPSKAGTYELRYYNGDSRLVMATRNIEITEAVVELKARDSIGQGFVIKVDWVGPGARYDEIQVWDPNARGGEGKKLFTQRVRNGDFDNQKVTLPGPTKVGTYELRYYNGDNKSYMATRPIEVTAIEISLEGPEVVEPETKFGVIWAGPGARYDEVQIYDPNRDKVLVKKRLRNDDYDNNKVSIKAPKQTGEFVLRYYNGDNKAVLAEQPLSVN